MTDYLVITGASHGIGEKTAEKFLKDGWQVINISRSNSKVAGVKNFNIDLGNPEWPIKHTDALDKAVKDANKICLVHNAAVFKSDDVMSLEPESLRHVLDVNVVAPSTLNKIFHYHMKPGSSIIYVGSTLSEMGVPGRASYVTSKHAIVGLMRSTCQDLAGQGIHTCCVCPGFVNTKMLTEGLDIAMLNNFIASKVTAKRLLEPEEIADFIHYCAGNPIINGSVLHTNLGQVMS